MDWSLAHWSQQLNLNKSIYDQNPVPEPAIYFGLKSNPPGNSCFWPWPWHGAFLTSGPHSWELKESILSNQLLPKAFVPSAQDFPESGPVLPESEVVTHGGTGPLPGQGQPGPHASASLQLSSPEPSGPLAELPRGLKTKLSLTWRQHASGSLLS